jgi:hypothetical protein
LEFVRGFPSRKISNGPRRWIRNVQVIVFGDGACWPVFILPVG